MSSEKILVISTSLNPASRSKVLAKQALKLISSKASAEWIDLQDFPLPLCDGGKAYSDPNVAELSRKIKEARCILVATPIYNFDVNAALKNLIELTGKAWTDKTVGFICAAGGKSSYMSVMGVANSLMLDFRSIIIPRFVYTDGDGFDGDELTTAISSRLEDLCNEAIRLNEQLRPVAKV